MTVRSDVVDARGDPLGQSTGVGEDDGGPVILDEVDQSILGRILNYGSVVVSGAGAPRAPIPGISAPLNFRGRLNSILEEQTAKA